MSEPPKENPPESPDMRYEREYEIWEMEYVEWLDRGEHGPPPEKPVPPENEG